MYSIGRLCLPPLNLAQSQAEQDLQFFKGFCRLPVVSGKNYNLSTSGWNWILLSTTHFMLASSAEGFEDKCFTTVTYCSIEKWLQACEVMTEIIGKVQKRRSCLRYCQDGWGQKAPRGQTRDKVLKLTSCKFERPLLTRRVTGDITRILRCDVSYRYRSQERHLTGSRKDSSSYICRQVQRQKHRCM